MVIIQIQSITVLSKQNRCLFINYAGPASAPAVIIIPGGLTNITLQMTVPSYGEICVDNYNVTLSEGAGGRTLFREDVVMDATQEIYTFDFSGFDLCSQTLPDYTVSAVAITNGVEGTKAEIPMPLSVDKTSIIIMIVYSVLLYLLIRTYTDVLAEKV